MPTVTDFFNQIIENVEKVIIGKRSIIELLSVALLCEGHILLEDVPGTGKTMLARSLAISMGGSFKRVQCTPDLLPNDITGVSIYNLQMNEFEFRPGPVFVNILLADEINRATPRTQSALLEAMQEQQVTVDGITHPLPRPFLVLATQNPIEYEGTFPLPEAQLDRFLMRIPVGYPSFLDEKTILSNLRYDHPINHLEPIRWSYAEDNSLTPLSILIDLQRMVQDVYIDDTLQEYVLRLINSTRSHPDLALGCSPRASLALYKSSQALAALRGRDYVIPEDVKYLAPYTLMHRMLLRSESELRGRTTTGILRDLLEKTSLELGSN
jgi:MoxR-like ATPase